MARAINETNAELSKKVQDGERYRKTTLIEKFKAQPKVAVTISPMYEGYFGRVMQVIINGCTVGIPCDGREYMVAAAFASEANSRRMQIDEQRARQARMANVSNNKEGYMRELSIF